MSELTLESISTQYFDVLKELGNIGAGNATTALASLLQCKVDMKVPQVLTLDFKEKHPQTPWKVIVKMRHVMVHGYYSIQMPIVWDIIQNDFPVLRPQIVTYLAEFGND